MSVLALDIGGANIKWASAHDAAGSKPFALWRAVDALPQRLGEIVTRHPCETLLVTMTAELCDCFETKAEGVRRILDAVEAVADGAGVHVWSTSGGFVTPTEARAAPMHVAAANWHALATWLGAQWPGGASLLMDVGSTTSDLIPLVDGQCGARGRTDAERLASGELVYLGARRTPLMAVGARVRLDREYALMAERFATVADVLVLTGELDGCADCTDTADGRPLTRHHAAARVLRMIGGDLDTFTVDDAVAMAQQFHGMAVGRLRDAAARVMRARAPVRVIVSGSGAMLAEAAAAELWPGIERIALGKWIGAEASVAACAVAMRALWSGE